MVAEVFVPMLSFCYVPRYFILLDNHYWEQRDSPPYAVSTAAPSPLPADTPSFHRETAT